MPQILARPSSPPREPMQPFLVEIPTGAAIILRFDMPHTTGTHVEDGNGRGDESVIMHMDLHPASAGGDRTFASGGKMHGVDRDGWFARHPPDDDVPVVYCTPAEGSFAEALLDETRTQGPMVRPFDDERLPETLRSAAANLATIGWPTDSPPLPTFL